ncbi:MAG: caspase family protein [Rhizobiales bacterium]|nr:caspase family protein [Hyphomicrobiales bacterium]
MNWWWRRTNIPQRAWITALFILFGIILYGSPLRAGLAVVDTCDAACEASLQSLLIADQASLFPAFNQPVTRFDGARSRAACEAPRPPQPAVHALILAPSYRGFIPLPGTQNDARLLHALFHERGVNEGLITVLSGPEVTRPLVLEKMEDLLACVRERDQVVVTFSGAAGSYNRWGKQSFVDFVGIVCSGELTPQSESFCEQALADAKEDKPDSARRAAYERQAEKLGEVVLMTSELSIPDQGKNRSKILLEGVRSTELSNFVTQIRNRGADAFVVLDTNFAAGVDLLSQQKNAVADSDWTWDTTREAEPKNLAVSESTVELFGAGDMAAFYATDSNRMALESKAGKSEILGELMFAVSEALRETPDPTVKSMASAIRRIMSDRGAPVFEATNADLRFLSPRADAPRREGDIEIIEPALKRSAQTIEEPSFTLVARYAGEGRAFRAVVDSEIVEVDQNGQFRKLIETAGKKAVTIRVLANDWSTLAVRTLAIAGQDEEAITQSPGRRYALIIANSSYSDPTFPTLQTPAADADAIARVLSEQYGFMTALPAENGKTLDLRMTNAKKADIQQMLFELRRRLASEDQLLVYYAGHGENDPDLGAYWVPVDGQSGADYTWIAADEITRELKRMNPQSILVIADSCYAGGLSRSAADAKPSLEARNRFLNKAAGLKSRQLIASGGEEPVEDAGGAGHSVFARAMIDALISIKEPAFTASELLEVKLKPAVISAVNSVGEGQTPGFYRIVKAGDEPGSEFVFVRRGEAVQ